MDGLTKSLPARAHLELNRLLEQLHSAEESLREFFNGQTGTELESLGPLQRQIRERLQRHSDATGGASATQNAVLDSLHEQIALVDRQGKIYFLNKSWRLFSGSNPLLHRRYIEGENYLRGCEQAEGDGAHDARKLGAGIERVLRGEEPHFNFKYPVGAGPDERCFRAKVLPLGDGDVQGAIIMHTDVTELHFAEEKRKAALQELQQVMTFSLDVICTLDEDGRFIQVSPACEKMLGRTAAELVGTPYLDCVRPESRAQTNRFLEQIRGGQIIRRFESRHQGREGDVLDVEWSVNWSATDKHLFCVGHDVTENRRAEDILRRNEVMASGAQRIARFGIWEAELNSLEDIETNPLFWSDGVYRIFGYVPGQISASGPNFFRSVHPEDRARVKQAMMNTLHHGHSYRLDHRIVLPDGRIRHVYEEAHLTRDLVTGLPRKMLGIVQDITERKTSELRLQRLNQFYSVLSKINETILKTGSERPLLEKVCRIAVGEGALKMAWIGEADMASKRIVPLMVAGENNGYVENLNLSTEAGMEGDGPGGSALREGQPIVCGDIMADAQMAPWREAALERGYRSIVAVPLKLGARRQGLLGFYSSEPRFFDGDEVKLLVAIADNLSFALQSIERHEEQKAAQEKLTEQAALLNEARDAIVVRDLDSRVLFWNKSAERLYGWTSEEVLGRKVSDFLYGASQKFREGTQQVLAAAEWNGELEQLTKSGALIIMDCRWTLLRDAAGAPRAVLCINTDITERKKMEAHLLRAQRMESIGTLAGGIAHDLNNLLAPVVMGVELLRHFGIEGPAREVVDNIERSARRGTSLVKQVLTFARGAEGARVAVHLGTALQEIEAMISGAFPKSIILTTEVAPNLWLTSGDPTQIHQVLLNFCVNARDAMPDGGSILVKVENAAIETSSSQPGIPAGRYVLITVEDTGCGIPPENLEKIFDPFFTTKELSKGTGLGLATVLGIVRAHHGFLNVSSEVGRGTIFKVYLPAHSSAEMGPEEQDAAWPRGNGECILLVDDETSILNVTQQTLEAFGYRVLTASHGANAVSLFGMHRDKIALVLIDMMMPVMDGPSTISALRSIDPNVRIVAASGLNASGTFPLAAKAGVQHFLAKPFTTGTMLSTLRAALTDDFEAPRRAADSFLS